MDREQKSECVYESIQLSGLEHGMMNLFADSGVNRYLVWICKSLLLCPHSFEHAHMHRHRKPQLPTVQTLDCGACAHIKCMGFPSLYSMFRTVNGRDNAREKYPAAKIYSKMFIKLTSGNEITLHLFPIPLVSTDAVQQERKNSMENRWALVKPAQKAQNRLILITTR